MKRIKSYLKIILGSFIIGVSLNLFFLDFKLIPTGIFGISVLYSTKMEFEFALTLFLLNVLFILIGYLTIPKKKLKKAILLSFLIPLFVYLTKNVGSLIDIKNADMLLITVFGAALVSIGSSLIYKEERYIGGNDIIELIAKEIAGPNGKVFLYVLDLAVIIFTIINFGYELGMYSLIAMTVIEIMNKRSTIGVSDSKVFYIITKEEAKVKRFIMEEMHYDLTIYDVKGGYSKSKSRVIMSAIPTKDYYKLREGIKEIDPKAFISITDSYEVVNGNVSIGAGYTKLSD